MPGVPSNKACERCKKRHIKCDEIRPQCQRCINAGVECPGYSQTRKFIDQGATVRRRYAPYQEIHVKTNAEHKQEVDLVYLQANPLAQPTLTTSGHYPRSPHGANPRDASRSTPRSPGMPSNGGNVLELTHEFNNIAHAAGASHHDQSPSTADSSMKHTDEHEDFRDIFSELMTGTEHELAFLTRHFAENLAPWLDLSDAAKFFSVHVPIRALNNVSMRYAMAAFAAKQLGRVKGVKCHTGRGILTSPAVSEIYPNSGAVDWFLKGVNYYYLAISDLAASASDGYSSVSTSAVLDSPIDVLKRWLPTQLGLTAEGKGFADGTFLRKVEDIFATVAILISYKLLDAKGEEWHMYLASIQEVFEMLKKAMGTNSSTFSHAIRASFWNFARLDYLGSYYIRAQTHLNPSDTSLWRAAGMFIDENEKAQIIDTVCPYIAKEDQTLNSLNWLAIKVVNFLARSKEVQVAQWTGSPVTRTPSSISEDSHAISAQSPQYPDTNTWLGLCFDLQTWFEGVPETIRPCVRIEHPRDPSSPANSPPAPFPEVFHALSTCAAAMQHYNFVRIALLLNRPPDEISGPSTAFDRLQGYREVTKEVEHRCREVCGIAFGRPHAEVRINMIPLLYAMGQCLESSTERQIIVDLLRGIEADLGLATDYAVQKLQSSWNRG
ncbi:hypothetical protein N7539_006491 [Penicillium diatomitis]|uniref:Zn(2)-C6 fungal-type domain-containing protein n=1 Tax=Penicillium diatomitis TaxID=2819901 RepID=A0A9W9X3T9_9EURO|nr:uncharacterized protein N7539_006491 [Penicillium diatomitis]KAJ5483045.1 hypothetical protein N7539_006491 [Penicillium diatomitis]